MRNGPHAMRNGPRAMRNGPCAMRNGPRAMRNGPCAVRNGPRAMRNGPCAVRDGPRAVRTLRAPHLLTVSEPDLALLVHELLDRALITRPEPSRAGTTSATTWPVLREAVERITLDLRSGEVVRLPLAAAGGAQRSPRTAETTAGRCDPAANDAVASDAKLANVVGFGGVAEWSKAAVLKTQNRGNETSPPDV
jgi:hypothetical protein